MSYFTFKCIKLPSSLYKTMILIFLFHQWFLTFSLGTTAGAGTKINCFKNIIQETAITDEHFFRTTVSVYFYLV